MPAVCWGLLDLGIQILAMEDSVWWGVMCVRPSGGERENTVGEVKTGGSVGSVGPLGAQGSFTEQVPSEPGT